MTLITLLFCALALTAAIFGMVRWSRRLHRTAGAQRARRTAHILVATGFWLVVAGGGVMLTTLLTGALLEGFYPPGAVPGLTRLIAALIVVGGALLALASVWVPAVLGWLLVQRFGVKALAEHLRLAIKAHLPARIPKPDVWQLGRWTLAVAAGLVQLIGGLFFLLIKAGLEAEPELESEDAGYFSKGLFYNYATYKWDHGCSLGGRYHHSDDD